MEPEWEKKLLVALNIHYSYFIFAFSALLSEMCELGGGDRRIIFNRFCKPLLASLLDFHWTVHCHQQYIFKALVFYTGKL